MSLHLGVGDLEALPRIAWRWEPETDILAGGLQPTPEGEVASLELSGHDGSVVVVDLVGNRLASLDVVVWPEVTTVAGLLPPAPSRRGALLVQAPRPIPAGEIEVALAVRASPDEDVIHVRVGAPRPAVVLQAADHLLVELDEAGGLAGFWLTGVPPLDGGEGE
jgi:hypothetical protein